MDFKGSHFKREIVLCGIRWYVASPISYRQLEEMRKERGVSVDHSTLNRWVIKYAPEIEKHFRLRKRPVGKSWRMDETYIRVKGEWKYLFSTAPSIGTVRPWTFCSRRSAIKRPLRPFYTKRFALRDSRRRS